MAKKPIIKGGDYTKVDMEHAAADARQLIANSPALQACVAMDIISRRMYMVMRSVMEGEVTQEWEVTNPELVMQVLVMSAQERANSKFTVLELQQELLQTAVPFLDILVQQEIEAGTVQPPEPTPTEEAEVKDVNTET